MKGLIKSAYRRAGGERSRTKAAITPICVSTQFCVPFVSASTSGGSCDDALNSQDRDNAIRHTTFHVQRALRHLS